ncbi:MAG TPA: hypothetical protein VLH75_10630 [Longimicrobiales bacterium]|nr:hypothetical protein [Longimicrobiales bacterium]
MTLTARQLAYGAAAVALLLVARHFSRPEEVVETITHENPLVIEPPSLRVATGTDTITIMGPALFIFVGLDPEGEDLSPRLLDAARELQTAADQAAPGLQALGVRVFSVDRPPVPLGLPPEADAGAGPRLEPGGVGVLLADPQGRMMRTTRVAGGAALVCAAARTFGREPPPAFAPACR